MKKAKKTKIISTILQGLRAAYFLAFLLLAGYEVAETSHMRSTEVQFMQIQVSYMQWQVSRGTHT